MQKKLLYACSFFCFTLLFVGFFHPITAINEDLGRHLLLGEIIAQTHHVPETNLLSYTFPSYPFINTHWLSEVIFYHSVALLGFNGLLIFSTTLTLLSFSIIFFVSYKNHGLAASTFSGLILLPLLLTRTDIRPEVFSFLFVSLFLLILYANRSKPTYLIYALIPLEMLWVNTHIYFPIGIVLLMLFLLDSVLTSRSRKKTLPIKHLGIVLGLTCIATVINPHGVMGAVFPFTVLQNYGLPVIENQSVFTVVKLFHQTQTLYCLTVIGLLFLLLFFNRKRVQLLEWLIALCFSIAAVAAIRNFPLFAYIIYVPLALALASTLPYCSRLLARYTSTKIATLLSCLTLLIVLLLLSFTTTRIISFQQFGLGMDERGLKAINFYRGNNLKGPIYNNFDIGSYLAYRLYPQEQVFVEGRPEAYPKDFFQKIYIPMQSDMKLFEQQATKYQFKTIFLTHWDQTNEENILLKHLLKDDRYSLVYLDDYAVIFVRADSVTDTFLSTYQITEKTFQVKDVNNTKHALRYLAFFKKVQWQEQERILSKQIQKKYSEPQQ